MAITGGFILLLVMAITGGFILLLVMVITGGFILLLVMAITGGFILLLVMAITGGFILLLVIAIIGDITSPLMLIMACESRIEFSKNWLPLAIFKLLDTNNIPNAAFNTFIQKTPRNLVYAVIRTTDYGCFISECRVLCF